MSQKIIHWTFSNINLSTFQKIICSNWKKVGWEMHLSNIDITWGWQSNFITLLLHLRYGIDFLTKAKLPRSSCRALEEVCFKYSPLHRGWVKNFVTLHWFLNQGQTPSNLLHCNRGGMLLISTFAPGDECHNSNCILLHNKYIAQDRDENPSHLFVLH